MPCAVCCRAQPSTPLAEEPGAAALLTPSAVQVHPLHASAAGLQLLAKTKLALAELNVATDQREIRQGYIALVAGKLQVPPTI